MNETALTGPAEPQLTGLKIGGAVTAMLLYPALKVGAFAPEGSVAAVALSSIIAYFLAMYLYYSIADLAYQSRTLPLWLGGLGGAVLAAALTGGADVALIVTSWSSVWLVALVAGRLTLAQRRRTTVYVISFLLLAALALIELLPRWEQTQMYLTGLGATMQSDLQNNMLASGYTPEMVQSYGDTFKRILDGLIRLTPTSVIMSAVTQFSIGYLWFLHRNARADRPETGVDNFVLWKMPFGFTPVLIAAILTRLWGGETLQLVADNAIIITAFFYCVSGLSVIEYYLRKFGVTRLFRIMFFLLLFFTQIVGLAVTVLLGFIDSFADWRKLNAANMSIET